MKIAIDGLAGSGKTTAGKRLANDIGFRFISSGMLYRLKALKAEENLMEAVKSSRLSIEWGIRWDGEDITDVLQKEEVGERASQIALREEVRKEINDVLRYVVEGGNYVIEGRDIGTIVFPEAEVKFYLTASEEVREKRRAEQLGEEVKITDRDIRDISREIAPTKAATDAILIDNSAQDVRETVQEMKKHIPKDGFDFQRFLQYVLGPIVKGLFHVEVDMKQPLTYGRWILTPNHISGWDPICLAASMPRPLHFMAKEELKKSLGPLLPLIDVSPIARDKPDMTAIKTVRHLLSQDKLVVMYPEGHRYRDGTMGEFRNGAFYFLRKRISPVVPVVIKGLEHLSVSNFFTRHVKICFLDPIYPIDVLGMKDNEIADKVRAEIMEIYQML
jgi:cytidylate kinase